MIEADILVHNIGQLLTMDPASGGIGDEKQDPMAGLGMVLNGAIAIKNERVVWVGKENECSSRVRMHSNTKRIDVGGRTVMPGLVDCHTHLVFAGSRAQDFSRRLAGANYEEILAAGGGILSTVKATRAASLETLIALAKPRLDRFLEFGVTTIEAKSGYGLTTEAEMKILSALSSLQESHPLDIVPTFLGAHVVPLEYRHNRDAYVDCLVQEMLPLVVERGLATFCDVFCEKGAFSIPETRRILKAASELGLKTKLHAEQLSQSGSIDLALEFSAVSVDHLENISKDDMAKLAQSTTVGVLLPGATYYLGKTDFANGRMLSDKGVAVAVSTDLNPGSCMTENLPLMLNLACLYSGLFPREAFLGATRRAAQALDLQHEIGSIMPGYLADILVLDLRDYRNLVVHFGVNHTYLVLKRGKIVYSKPNTQKEKIQYG